MPKYRAVYKNKTTTVEADTKYAAQCAACAVFHIPQSRGYMVNLALLTESGDVNPSEYRHS